jgi:uncharacterized protein YbjT (DUF2867 family)
MDAMHTTQPAVAVIGATGYTGRFVVADLLRRGITPIAIARNAAALDAASAPLVRKRPARFSMPKSC